MEKEYYIWFNKVKFEFNSPNIEDTQITEDFNYNKKPFVITKGVINLLVLKPNLDEELQLQITFNKIIRKIYETWKLIWLDYLQKLEINWTKCRIIDNWEDICLMLPCEY